MSSFLLQLVPRKYLPHWPLTAPGNGQLARACSWEASRSTTRGETGATPAVTSPTAKKRMDKFALASILGGLIWMIWLFRGGRRVEFSVWIGVNNVQ